MLLWLRYLKQLEVAGGDAPPGGAADFKTMCEDEEWGNESEAMPGEPRTPSSGGERAASSGGASPASGGSPAASPPRLRLNTSLATDPALAPQATSLKHEPPSPSPPPPPAPQARDYLALTAAAFPGLFPASTAPSYVCKPCGIRYSSLSTLQAHQEHYCSNRLPKPTEGANATADPSVDESSSDAKTPRPAGKQYACTYCSYSADKKVSLNRHMRMHSSSPVSSGTPAPTPTSNGEATEGPPVQDRYCADCDIRFSSIKTYRAHKQHYCSTRQVVKQALAAARGGSATSGSAPPSPGATPPAQNQYALALPTNPILIVPYSLLRSASTLPGATLPDPDTPCFLLPNGTFQPISRALSNINADGKEPEVLKSANRPREPSRDGATPLDLSVRRSPESVVTDEHEKENRIRSATPEQIVCAPSLPGSPGTPSPSRRSSSPSAESSPKRRRRNSRGPTPKPPSVPSPPEEKFTPIVPPAILPPALAIRLASELPVTAASPQVLVKQGVSKCKECNIVFCKYENYRIHKRHYCSAGGGEERASPAPPEPGPPPQYRQLICLACGIHFSSLDNLTTHQSFYCTKRETRSPRSVPEAPRPTSGSEGGWKCPCCEVVSPTAAAAQRHMEAHAGVKAFRCTICRYRGNTLRGMRTHIRMHFNNKKPADLQEESYIACVLEEDSREATSPSPAVGGERVHRCGSCAYTSTYRGNVVRHARLVHATDEPEEEQTSPVPTVDIKKEPETELEETPNYCKSCDISFKYVNTYKAHKQFYCTANNQDAAANNNVPTPARVTDTPVL
ncbi:zinc finger protein ush-like isoform X1 [Trichoplusia ni]|uniref:Zinc finger protein ush-like isoform X1 n=2 Tax=Trichoplusia ni TaxID=7111 RepID=A0A7E5WD00_TRINI|nr:zinc finger protein ush-like isoform X1 [Trichoplusia ni]